LAGYAPLFGSIATGTLYGKWPDIGLWAIVLSQADKNGVLDVTPQYLAGVTGLPVDQVTACMERFCAPDPGSRTKDLDGARLELLDPDNRNWGWRVVNHGKYREKARLMAKSEREVSTGANAARLRKSETIADGAEKAEGDDPVTADHRRPPPPTAADRPSDSYANTSVRGRPKGSKRSPEGFEPDLDFARKTIPDIDADAEAEKFRDFEFSKPRTDWAATWRNWIRECKARGQYARRSNGGLHAGVVMR
jgi:hypothetical protein